MKNKVKWLLASVGVAIVGAAGTWRSRAAGQFDPVAWQDEKRLQDGKRLEMADEVVAAKMLSGMTRAQVAEMLGEPPPTGYFKTWDMVYYLGDERGYISIDSEWLVVKLDPAGKVSEYRIVRD